MLIVQVTSSMPVCQTIPEKDGGYSIRFTCTHWFLLFKICNAYTGEQGIYFVTNFMVLRDIDLTALRT
jgi:hypothetical protein